MTVNVVDQTFSSLLNKQTSTKEPLLHELQLGERLNESVHQSRRSDFSLMLAMLCDDVREQSQFILPNSVAIDGTSINSKEASNQTLRAHFELPALAPLSLEKIEQVKQYNQGQLIADNHLASLQLSNALTPIPLAFRNNSKHISANILTNTSLVCQEKHARNQESKVINQPLNMHVENWLKAIQTSIVKATLVDTIAA